MRAIRLIPALLLLSAGFGPVPAADIATVVHDPSRVLPTDAELERAGARIGTITISTDDIFDERDPREDALLYRAVNRMHVATRDSTIRAQLLFASGDRYSRRVLDESERALRTQRYLREPVIRPVAWHDGLVDVSVRSRDVWTTNPGLAVSRTGGANELGAEIEELNLFGRGKQLSAGYQDDVDRASLRLAWFDPAVYGSRWTSRLSVSDSDDGNGWSLGLERPFFALDSRWSAGFSGESLSQIEPRYALGERIDAWRADYRVFDIHGGRSAGLRNGWVRRWTAGFRYDRSRFGRADTPLAGPLPADRTLAYPYLRLDLLQDDYATTRNLDQIGRTEDLAFGTRLSAELGWSQPAFGANREAVIATLDASRGVHLPNEQSLFVASRWSTRLEGTNLRDSLVSGSARYFWRANERTVLYVGLTADVGAALDLDHELLLGGDTGLRGYPLRYQTGTARALLTVEGRYFTDWYPLRLARVGAAVFVDIGRSWGASALDVPELGTLRDVGIGLRFGNTRSALGNVLHVDLAFPLDGDPSIKSMQFLLKTWKSF
ncbi:MAG: Outer membrane protein assembly factor BamA [Steroidobacteraceae bacterium]|nr:Outer membrane protein assembly factor BamA [Steroidobacteraceae bacterium]